MTKLLTVLAAVLLTATMLAQTPQKLSYQAVIRNSSDALVVNTEIGMQISILQGSETGTAVYTETQTPTTNINGLVSIKIGEGTGFNTIDWANGPYFIKTETDLTGGTSYTITGTSQLLSVPYALHANTVENIDDADADPLNELQTLSLDGTDLSISSGNSVSLIAIQDGYEPNTDEQSLSIEGTDLSISNGNSVSLIAIQDGYEPNTDEQSLSIEGTDLSISNGNSVSLIAVQDGYEPNTDEQNLSIVGTDLSISNGNSVSLIAIQDGYEPNTDEQSLSIILYIHLQVQLHGILPIGYL